MDDVRMDVRAEQYEQALALKDNFAALANWQTFFPYRPKKSPMEDPRGWWRCVRYEHLRSEPSFSRLLKKCLFT